MSLRNERWKTTQNEEKILFIFHLNSSPIIILHQSLETCVIGAESLLSASLLVVPSLTAVAIFFSYRYLLMYPPFPSSSFNLSFSDFRSYDFPYLSHSFLGLITLLIVTASLIALTSSLNGQVCESLFFYPNTTISFLVFSLFSSLVSVMQPVEWLICSNLHSLPLRWFVNHGSQVNSFTIRFVFFSSLFVSQTIDWFSLRDQSVLLIDRIYLL